MTTANKSFSQRLQWLDSTKGFAILLMVYGHCFSEAYLQKWYPPLLLTWIGSFHMPVFFVAAGYLFALKPQQKTFGAFLLSKVKRLLVPGLIYSMAYTAYVVIIKLASGNEVGSLIWQSVKETALLDFNGAMWFLPCLFFAELIFFFLLKLRKWYWMGLIATATAAFGMLSPFSDYFGVSWRRVGLAVFFLFAGFMFRYLVELKKQWYLTAGLIVLHLAGTFLNEGSGFAGLSFGRYPILFLVNGVAGSYAVALLFRLITRPLPALAWFGKNSMPILCTHIIFIEFLRLINSKILHLSWFDGVVLTLVVIALEIPAILFINRFIPFTIGAHRLKRQSDKNQ